MYTYLYIIVCKNQVLLIRLRVRQAHWKSRQDSFLDTQSLSRWKVSQFQERPSRWKCWVERCWKGLQNSVVVHLRWGGPWIINPIYNLYHMGTLQDVFVSKPWGVSFLSVGYDWFFSWTLYRMSPSPGHWQSTLSGDRRLTACGKMIW